MERASGVLLHITSLPNNIGIGTFGRSAYKFVDFLVESGQSYWQILPLTTTSYGDSPYQSFSAFAGNTHLIDFDLLVEDGFLTKDDYQDIEFGSNPLEVDYGTIYENRRPVLEKAVATFLKKRPANYKDFIQKNNFWLQPFAHYQSIKEFYNEKPLSKWPEPIRMQEDESLKHHLEQLTDIIEYHKVTQYFFFSQWKQLKSYANRNNILILGDLPIYVAEDSVEMWITPQYFKVDENNKPLTVSGTPPDYFSKEGQLWGNPIYDWEYLEKTDYTWWVTRIRESFKLYDIVRIDHFRGFESYWEVPADSETAKDGRWQKGPGIKLFNAVKKELGNLPIIAEDLGVQTQALDELMEQTGFPGMKILQFAFDGEKENTHLPHHYPPNSVAYVGTHDNETAMGWAKDFASQENLTLASKYSHQKEDESIAAALNRTLAASPSKTVIYQMQDLLELDNKARMNVPSTIGDNWKWRFKADALTTDLVEKLKDMTQTYFRCNENNFPTRIPEISGEDKIQSTQKNKK